MLFLMAFESDAYLPEGTLQERRVRKRWIVVSRNPDLTYIADVNVTTKGPQYRESEFNKQ